MQQVPLQLRLLPKEQQKCKVWDDYINNNDHRDISHATEAS